MTNADWQDAARVLDRCHHGVEWAWKLLDRLVAEERHAQIFSSFHETHLSTDLLNKAVDAWRLSPHVTMDPNLILAKMQGYAPNLYPDVRTYSMLVDAVTKKCNDPKQAPIFATLILDRMQREYEGGNSQVQPNEYTYGVVLEAWARSGLPEAANKTEQVLQEMEKEGVMPTNRCYHAAIASGPRDGRRAEALLEKMLSSPTVEVDAYSFGAVLNVWSKSGALDAAQRALAVFNRMEQLNETTEDDALKPNAFIYSSVLVTLGRSGQPQAAEDLLRQMQQNYEATGDADMRPTVVAYNAVMDAWSRSRDPNGPLRAESLLQQMLSDEGASPDTISFNCVIAGWSRSRDTRAAQKAESILALMHEMNKARNLDVKPNTISYNSVIAALSKCRHPQAAERAEATLERMKKLHEEGNRDVKPNTRTFNSVIAAWSRSKKPQAAERAEAVLERMHKLHKAGDRDVIPNTITYGSVIATWSRSRDPQAALKAESVLQRMHTLHKEGNREVKPNTICYNSALAAWSKCRSDSNAAERAESLLRRMQEMHNAGDLDVKPDAISYSCVIQGWSNSKDPKAKQRISVLKIELNRLKR
jgi:pentatricopeptide repeat protein